MKVTIIGSGYVGLTTGAVLAYLGNHVTLLDIDKRKIELLREGTSPIHERGLEELLRSGKERLTFTSSWGDFDPEADIVMIAVGTPAKVNGESNTHYVEEAARSIAERLRDGRQYTVVVKSTVPIGTNRRVDQIIRRTLNERGVHAKVRVASNPEFLREGMALYDSFYPDRIIIGAEDQEAIEMLRRLYRPLLEQTFEPLDVIPRREGYGLPPLITTDPISSEMIKYAANAFLALKISFINEIAGLCEKVGSDVTEVARGIGLDSRIGARFLQAGIGWGGSCFPKDTAALLAVGKEHNYDMPILEAARQVNQLQRIRVVEKLQTLLKGVRGRTIGVLGLAFKPNTDDVRESPALDIIRILIERGAHVRVHDPVAMENARAVLRDEELQEVSFVADPYEVADGAHALLLATEWPQYRQLDLSKMTPKMALPVFIDGRNVLQATRGCRVHLCGGRKMKHALVTGGAGFIGSHLVDRLLAEGWAVTVVDNFDPFYDPELKRSYVKRHFEYDAYRLVEADIRDGETFRQELSDDYDVLVHLAAKAGVRPSILDPIGYQEVNVAGTQNMLEFARERAIKQFIFASSSSVYGVNPNVPWREDDSVLLPISPYASTKVSGELLGHVYSHLYGIKFIALRFFTVYGPRQRPDLAIHKFARRMLRGEPITIYGDGTSRRDYTYIDDIVEGLRRAMDYTATTYELINLGNNRTVSLLEMVQQLELALGIEADLEFLPVQPGDVPQTWADLRKARAVLQYEPKVTLQDGLNHFIHWMRS